LKKHLCLLLFFIVTLGCRPTRILQIECYSVSNESTYSLDIHLARGKSVVKLSEIKLEAIDAILFRGITGTQCISQRPMLTQSKQEVKSNLIVKAIYGPQNGYEKYITNITSLDTILAKYRVTINKDLLRRDLTNTGLIKPLNNPF
jgi:hypothetical protein